MTKQKRGRGRPTWTDEQKRVAREKRDANRAAYGCSLSPDSLDRLRATREAGSVERRDNSKARLYLPELQHWILSLLQAKTNPAVFDALVAAHPERGIRWDHHHQHILFSFSTNSLRAQYAKIAEEMFRRLFVCVQPGGFSRKTREGYPSVWRLSEDALNAWLIQSQRRDFSVSHALKLLMQFPPLRRQAEDYVEVENEFELRELKGVHKRVMTPDERQAALAVRAEKQVAVDAKNRDLMKDWYRPAAPTVLTVQEP